MLIVGLVNEVDLLDEVDAEEFGFGREWPVVRYTCKDGLGKTFRVFVQGEEQVEFYEESIVLPNTYEFVNCHISGDREFIAGDVRFHY